MTKTILSGVGFAREILRGVGVGIGVGIAVAVAILLGGGIATAATATDASARLERALADYAGAQSETEREARVAGFARAAQGFDALTEEVGATAPLWTNVGNAALQAGEVGQAVLAYRRALTLDPDAVTANQNLVHVRSRLPAWVPRPTAEKSFDALRLDRRIPIGVRRIAGATFFVLAAASLVMAGRRGPGPWRGLALAFAAAWGLALLSNSALGERRAGEAAVVVADETVARSSDSVLAPLAFPDPLPQGVEVELLEAREDFALIRLANDRDVWVRRSAVEAVAE